LILQRRFLLFLAKLRKGRMTAMTTQAKMDAAVRRFEAALEQVEASFARLAAERAKEAELRRENEALKADTDRLREELENLRRRAKELTDLNRQAMLRIDKAMKRIRAVLGEKDQG